MFISVALSVAMQYSQVFGVWSLLKSLLPIPLFPALIILCTEITSVISISGLITLSSAPYNWVICQTVIWSITNWRMPSAVYFTTLLSYRPYPQVCQSSWSPSPVFQALQRSSLVLVSACNAFMPPSALYPQVLDAIDTALSAKFEIAMTAQKGLLGPFYTPSLTFKCLVCVYT